jgi:prophage regulatory protein
MESLQPDRLLISRKEVERITGLSRSHIYYMMTNFDFPRPVPVGVRKVQWKMSEVKEWIAKQELVRNEREKRRQARRSRFINSYPSASRDAHQPKG